MVAHHETFEELMDYVRDENLEAHTGCAAQVLVILKNLLDAQVREHILVREQILVRDILLFLPFIVGLFSFHSSSLFLP